MQIAVFAIMGVVALVTGLILMLVLPGLGYIALGIIGLGIILVAGAAIIEFRRVRSAVTSKRGKFSTSTTILVSVFAGIILLTNAIGVWKYHRFDFTGLSRFTLTSQTKDVLTKLDQPVDVICFFVPNDQYGAGAYAASLLTEYQTYTSKLIISRIDPDEHPEQARKYGIQEYQTVVFLTQKGVRLVTPSMIISEAEHAFTSAILEVTGQVQRKVYFLTGHGEASPLDTDSPGYSDVRNGLLDNLYQVDFLDLVATPAIPKDCAALIIAGPRNPMTDGERQIIADYLNNLGSVMFLTDPGSTDDIARLMAPWGIAVMQGTVIDPSSYTAPSKDSPTVPRTRDYLQLNTVYFPGVTALLPTPSAPKEVSIVPLVYTSKDAWMEKDYTPQTNPKYDEGTDFKSPGSGIVMGALITQAEIQTQNQDGTTTGSGKYYDAPSIVIIGDSDFATNKHFVNGDNSTFFLTLVNYLAAGKELISIDRKVLQTRRLILTPEKARFLNISSIGLLPAIVLAIGIAVWWQRRK